MASVFASFLEELEARTAIEDCLKRFARAVDRQDWEAARAAYHEDAFRPDFTVQKHGLDDPMYRLRTR